MVKCLQHKVHPEKCWWKHNPCYEHKRIDCKAQYCKRKDYWKVVSKFK